LKHKTGWPQNRADNSSW